MKKNEIYTVECEDLTDLGFGVSRIHGMTVFTSDLLPGEKAQIKIIKTAKKYAIGKILKRIEQSPDRVQPFCSVFGKCGGCGLQNLSYDAQIACKQKQLEDLFLKTGENIDVKPVLKMDKPVNYRNKAQFPIQVKDGRIVSGFYKSGTNEIVDSRDCGIQNPVINTIHKWILDHINTAQASCLRHILIRYARTSNEAQVVFIGTQDNGLKDFARRLHDQFPYIVSIVFNQNDCENNVILGEDYEVLLGTDYIEEDCLGLKIQLHFKSFFQVNPDQMEVLYKTALKMADLNENTTVVELYSGTGTIGLLAAREAKHVTGVEIVPEAVKNAQENARINGIKNADFVCEDASRFAHEQKNHADLVMVDPPRKGLTQQGITDICRIHPERIVYVSCNPRTLARDIDLFKKEGYLCRVIQPVDMFAQTAGIECAALFEKMPFSK